MRYRKLILHVLRYKKVDNLAIVLYVKVMQQLTRKAIHTAKQVTTCAKNTPAHASILFQHEFVLTVTSASFEPTGLKSWHLHDSKHSM